MVSVFVPSNAGFLSVDTSVGKAFTLPTSTELIGRVITFKDSTGNAQSGAIQIFTQGGDTFQDGTTTYTIQEAWGSATFVSRVGQWVLQQGNAQVIASSITATNITATQSNVSFYMSSVSAYTDYQLVQTSLVVNDGTLLVQNTSGLLPYNAVFATSNLNVTLVYGINNELKWEQIVRDIPGNPMGFVYGQGPETLTLDGKSGRVGIGVKSPQYNLDVSGTLFASSLATVSVAMVDVTTNQFNFLTTSSGILLLNGAGITGGGGGAGVAQLIAGSNITLDPIGGTGVVTVNATGGLSAANLTSSITGLGTVGYISSPSLQSTIVSTVEGIAFGIVDLLNNLGTYYGYISSPQLLSTVEGLGSAGYLSTGGSGVFSTVYINQTAQTAPFWDSNSFIAGNDPEPNPLNLDVFGSARILKNLYIGSTTTVIGTGGVATSFISTTGLTASSINLLDPLTGDPGFLTISSGILVVNNAPVTGGGGGLTTANLTSTVAGLGTTGFVSTLSLLSTVSSLGSLGYVSSGSLNSTILGLGTYGFVSTLSLRSTVGGLGQLYPSTSRVNAFFSTLSTTYGQSFNSSNATISTLFASNATMSNLVVSTITFDTGDGFIDFPDIRALSLSTFFINVSTVNVGTMVSTQVLEVSSIRGVTFLATSNLVSTTAGITTAYQQAGFISTLNLDTALASTTALLVTRDNLTSTTGGITTAYQQSGFISTANLNIALASTTVLLVTRDNLTSTTGGITTAYQQSGFISTANLNIALASTTVLLVTRDNLTSTTGGITTAYQQSGFISTANLNTALASTTVLLVTRDNLTSTTQGVTTAYQQSGFLSSANLTSTVTGLGSVGYLSSLVGRFVSTGFVTTSTLNLIDPYLGAQNYVTVSSGVLLLNGSAISGGGGGGGGVSQLVAGDNISLSPAGGTGVVTITGLIATNFSTQAMFTSSLLTSTIRASTIFTSTITGSLSQFVALSSLAMYTSSFYTATRQATPMFITF